MNEQHGVLLLESDIAEIKRIVMEEYKTQTQTKIYTIKDLSEGKVMMWDDSTGYMIDIIRAAFPDADFIQMDGGRLIAKRGSKKEVFAYELLPTQMASVFIAELKKEEK
jgi:hypothetical protein